MFSSNPTQLFQGCPNLFSFIAHEYLHQKQNLQILQTEGIGEKAVKFYTEIVNKANVDSFIKQFGHISKEELNYLFTESTSVVD